MTEGAVAFFGKLGESKKREILFSSLVCNGWVQARQDAVMKAGCEMRREEKRARGKCSRTEGAERG